MANIYPWHLANREGPVDLCLLELLAGVTSPASLCFGLLKGLVEGPVDLCLLELLAGVTPPASLCFGLLEAVVEGPVYLCLLELLAGVASLLGLPTICCRGTFAAFLLITSAKPSFPDVLLSSTEFTEEEDIFSVF